MKKARMWDQVWNSHQKTKRLESLGRKGHGRESNSKWEIRENGSKNAGPETQTGIFRVDTEIKEPLKMFFISNQLNKVLQISSGI